MGILVALEVVGLLLLLSPCTGGCHYNFALRDLVCNCRPDAVTIIQHYNNPA